MRAAASLLIYYYLIFMSCFLFTFISLSCVSTEDLFESLNMKIIFGISVIHYHTYVMKHVLCTLAWNYPHMWIGCVACILIVVAPCTLLLWILLVSSAFNDFRFIKVKLFRISYNSKKYFLQNATTTKRNTVSFTISCPQQPYLNAARYDLNYTKIYSKSKNY